MPTTPDMQVYAGGVHTQTHLFFSFGNPWLKIPPRYSSKLALVAQLRRPGGLKLVDHGNWFYGVFWQRRMRSISRFLPHQKIFILTKVIAHRRLALMSNSIACTDFNRDFTKMAIFQTSIPYRAHSFHGIKLKLGRQQLDIILNKSLVIEFSFRSLNSKCWP